MTPRVMAVGLALAITSPAVEARTAPGGAVDRPQAAAREYMMGTIVEVRVYEAPSRPAAAVALEAAFAELRAVDRLMAVQRPDSELTRLNREAGNGPVVVDARVFDVLETSLRVSRLTAGAFDVTVLPVVRAWGFTDGRPHRPAVASPAVEGFATVLLDRAARTVRFTQPGTQVDLGGIAKGYALDRARTALRSHGVRSAYLDAGGEIATVGHPPGGGYWRIGVRHPRRVDGLLGVLEVGEAAVSTSGDAEQYVDDAAGRAGHIFDPRTGRPARALASATIVTSSAALADALSTAAVVLGARRMERVLWHVDARGVFAEVDGGEAVVVASSPALRFARRAD